MGDDDRSDDGPDAWVMTAATALDPTDSLAIDDLLHDRWDIWQAMERACVAECCGLEAFDFGVDAVRLAVPAAERAAFASELAALERHLVASGASNLVSSGFCTIFDGTEFIEALRKIQRSLSLCA